MKTPKQFPAWLLAFGYVHEIWHYLAARFFGLNATIEPTHVWHETPDAPWKTVVISIAPFLVFTTAFLAVLYFWPRYAKTAADHRIWFGWAAICLGWMGTCLTDLRSLVRFFKTGRW